MEENVKKENKKRVENIETRGTEEHSEKVKEEGKKRSL